MIHERYGHQPPSIFGPGGPVTADTALISWSMAKSIVHAATGILVGDGALDLDAPAPVAAWRGTAKQDITLLQLLEMRSGLHFVEDYEDPATSNCLAMLFGDGAADMAAYAADQPLDHGDAADRQHRLGSVERGRTQPQALAAGLDERMNLGRRSDHRQSPGRENGRLAVAVLVTEIGGGGNAKLACRLRAGRDAGIEACFADAIFHGGHGQTSHRALRMGH